MNNNRVRANVGVKWRVIARLYVKETNILDALFFISFIIFNKIIIRSEKEYESRSITQIIEKSSSILFRWLVKMLTKSQSLNNHDKLEQSWKIKIEPIHLHCQWSPYELKTVMFADRCIGVWVRDALEHNWLNLYFTTHIYIYINDKKRTTKEIAEV